MYFPGIEAFLAIVKTENLTKAAEALHLMEKNQPRPITVLPVVDKDRKCLGLVHITDLLRRGIV